MIIKGVTILQIYSLVQFLICLNIELSLNVVHQNSDWEATNASTDTRLFS